MPLLVLHAKMLRMYGMYTMYTLLQGECYTCTNLGIVDDRSAVVYSDLFVFVVVIHFFVICTAVRKI